MVDEDDRGSLLSSSIILPYVLLCFVLKYFIANTTLLTKNVFTNSTTKNILLLTAHPDDECMFFSPTILQLKKQEHNVYIMCMTTGNFYKISIRKTELKNSCQILGIPEKNINIIDDSSLPDNPDETWPEDVARQHILNYVHLIKADVIITFDSYGVSGHKNHQNLYFIMKKLKADSRIPDIKVFTLESTGLARKYISFLDIPYSYFSQQNIFVSTWAEVVQAQRAMYAHRSQFEWFRILYILFSRYMMINTLEELT